MVPLVVAALVMSTGPAAACSPPRNPTINDVEPTQIVVLGTTGERVAGGRLFHVERAWNDRGLTTPILIAFKEGEPVGDCSYPVSAGTRLIVTPEMDGARLSADLGTLQAHPDSETGRRDVAEAVARFGPGIVPTQTTPEPAETASGPDVTLAVVGVGLGLVALLGTIVVIGRVRRAGEPNP